MPSELFIVENKRKERAYRQAFPNAQIYNLSTQFDDAYDILYNRAATDLTPKIKDAHKIDELKKTVSPFTTIYLTFDPLREDLALKCSCALKPLLNAKHLIRLRPNSLHPAELIASIKTALYNHKKTSEKPASFYPMEAQRTLAIQLLHLLTAKHLKKTAHSSTTTASAINPLTLSQLLILETIQQCQRQDKHELRENWYEISLQLPLYSTDTTKPPQTFTAQLVVPDKSLALQEHNPSRKALWDSLTNQGRQNQKKNRIHEEFFQLAQASPNNPWRFADTLDCYEVIKQLQANPKLIVSSAYTSEPPLEKIIPPFNTLQLYQNTAAPHASYLHLLHRILHEDLYQNGLITYPETRSNRFPDAHYDQLAAFFALTKANQVFVHRPFEDPAIDKNQIGILPTYWSINTKEKLNTYLQALDPHYAQSPRYLQMISDVYLEIYHRALESQRDMSSTSIDYIYLIGPVSRSGLSLQTTHDHWIFRLRHERARKSPSLMEQFGLKPEGLVVSSKPIATSISQIKPPTEIGNLLLICKQWEICSPQRLYYTQLPALLRKGLLKKRPQSVNGGSIDTYHLASVGKDTLQYYKEHLPTAVNLTYYRRFHQKLRHTIQPQEPKMLIDTWLESLSLEITRQKTSKWETRNYLKKLSDT